MITGHMNRDCVFESSIMVETYPILRDSCSVKLEVKSGEVEGCLVPRERG